MNCYFILNPAYDKIEITPNFSSELKSAEILNIAGEKLMDFENDYFLKNNTIDISSLPSGIYLYFHTDKTLKVAKLIKRL
ncbi:MAG: T9SS type A sorting domain-containing protein [Saprospiraceae bacterium]